MQILYIGSRSKGSNSLARAEALRRLGHGVEIVDPCSPLENLPFRGAISTRLGFRPFVPFLKKYLLRQSKSIRFDLVWVNEGAEVPSACVKAWSNAGKRVVYYSSDDPYGQRDRRKWDLLRASAKHAFLHAVVRDENIEEALEAGFPHVMRVVRSYDPVNHKAVEWNEADAKLWSSDVVFVGIWFPERGPFLRELVERGVPLAIWGNRWEKAPEWPILKDYWRGPGIRGGNYVKALQYAKIALGLVSEGNRDQHTTRSSEIPFIGTLFCGKRSRDHSSMFEENKEAVFWDDAAECAERCRELLAHPPQIERIASAGRERVLVDQRSNDEVCKDILVEVEKLQR